MDKKEADALWAAIPQEDPDDFDIKMLEEIDRADEATREFVDSDKVFEHSVKV